MAKFDADWWELYSSKNGAEKCAKHITHQLMYQVRKACECMIDDPMYTSKQAADQIFKEMYGVMLQYSEWGATDTEPMGTLRAWLNEKFNVEVGW